MPGLVELFEDIRAKRDAGMKASTALQDEEEWKDGEPCSASPTPEIDIVFTLPGKDGTEPTTVKASSLTDSTQREIVDSILNTTRQTLASQIVLVSQEPEEPHPDGLQRALMQTAMKTARGVPNLKEPSSHRRFL